MRGPDIDLLVGYPSWMRDRVLDAAAGLPPEAFAATATAGQSRGDLDVLNAIDDLGRPKP